MTAEDLDLHRRARRHAALAEPVRLRIVDLLALGDLSPGQVQGELGIGSNLLAHHLGVLESAGLIARTRSEGDRRRSYLRLDRDALPGPTPAPVVRARRVVFVCTGNAARSPLAAALWASVSPVPAVSGGTHPAPATSPRAIASARRHGIDLTGHRPHPVGPLLAAGDAVITLCDRAHEELALGHALHWSVPDPGRVGTAEAYDAAFEVIAGRVEHAAVHIAAAG